MQPGLIAAVSIVQGQLRVKNNGEAMLLVCIDFQDKKRNSNLTV
jgi:hypothetical protein